MHDKIKKESFYKFFSVLILTVCFLAFSGQAFAHEKHNLPWGYEGGTGPEHWGEIEHDHEKHIMCRKGVYQSPIDIRC